MRRNRAIPGATGSFAPFLVAISNKARLSFGKEGLFGLSV